MADKPLYYTVIESLAGEGFEYTKGEVVDANDPGLKKWPNHFAPLIVRSHGKPIEQATASPGEKRNVAPPQEPEPKPEPEPEPEPKGKALTTAGMKGKG